MEPEIAAQQRLGESRFGTLYGQAIAADPMLSTLRGQAQRKLEGEAIDPQVLAEMTRSGLAGAAGALGAVNLRGGGSAGQAAIARNLGVSAADYIAQQRERALAETNLTQQLEAARRGEAAGYATGGAGVTAQLGGLRGELLGRAADIATQATGQYGQAADINTQAGGLYGQAGDILGQASNIYGQGANIVGQGGQMLQSATGQLGTAGQLQTGAGELNRTAAGITAQAQNYALQQRNLANQEFTLANQLNRPRQFGIGGAAMAQIAMANTATRNNFELAKTGINMQQNQMSANIAGQNAANSAAQTNSYIGAGASVAAAGSVAAFSWCSRVCFGYSDPRWILMREWWRTRAPRWLYRLYLKYGERTASFLRPRPLLRRAVRSLMSLCLGQ
jgi:hypothetical protein